MSDQRIAETIKGYLTLILLGEDESDVLDNINSFCSQFGDRGFDIKDQVFAEWFSV
jgi:hypothetical protein